MSALPPAPADPVDRCLCAQRHSENDSSPPLIPPPAAGGVARPAPVQPVSEHALGSGGRSQGMGASQYVKRAPAAVGALVFGFEWLHIAPCNRFQKPLAERGL